MAKEYLKMADSLVGEVFIDSDCLLSRAFGEIADFSGYNKECRNVAHAINSRDELVEEVERLRAQIKDAFIDGCQAGWDMSGEGFNAEYCTMSDDKIREKIIAKADEYTK